MIARENDRVLVKNMASLNGKDTKSRKASSLTDETTIQPATASRGGAAGARPDVMPHDGRKSKDTVSVGALRRRRRGARSVVVDIILLVVLAGLIVGAVFGYRAIREVYVPTWEKRVVVFRVQMSGLDPNMVPYSQGQIAFTNKSMWSSDRSDADCLGTVTKVDSENVEVDGRRLLNLTLTVEASADYLESKGYRMGETMLLAGTEGTYRVEGLVADGMIISMHEKKDDVVETEAGTTLVPPPAAPATVGTPDD